MNAIPILKLKDDRTGLSYFVAIHDLKFKEKALEKLQQKMDHDYFERLPVEERVKRKKIDTDFTCPFCKEKTQISSRKDKATYGFLFVRTEIFNVFKCHKCNKEFLETELQREKKNTYLQNKIIERFEREKQNPTPNYISPLTIDKFIITPNKEE